MGKEAAVTNGQPASTSLRASRQDCPTRCIPYRSRTAAGSRDRSKAPFAAGDVISR